MGPELVETWGISNRINRYLLDAIADDALRAKPAKPAKGRRIAEIFAHLHNVRIDWLKSSSAGQRIPTFQRPLAQLGEAEPTAGVRGSIRVVQWVN